MSIYDTLNPKQKEQSYIQMAPFLYWRRRFWKNKSPDSQDRLPDR